LCDIAVNCLLMLLVALVKGILRAVTPLQPYWLNC